MNPTNELVDDIYREKVLRARAMSEEERFRAGPELFDFACAWTKSGIRMDHPDADEECVLELLRSRLALSERLEAVP